MNKAIDMAFSQGLVSTKIDVWLNGQALFDPVFKWYLNDLKINLPNKSYSRDNRLHLLASSHEMKGLAPRCRLILSKIWSLYYWWECSSQYKVRELGSKRCKSVWYLSTKFGRISFISVRKDQQHRAQEECCERVNHCQF